MARPLIVDGRNFLDAAALRAAGFEYEGIGRAVETAPSQPSPTECRRSSWSAGEGTRLRPADRDGAEAGPDPRRPALPRLHGRVARPARGRGGRPRLRLPARRAARGARRRRARRAADPLRRRARAARHGRGDPLRRRRARRRARRALPRAQRRRPHRPRPERPAGAPTSERGARATIALHPVEDSSAYGLVTPRRGRRRRSSSSRRPASTSPARSTPACTCSSARCST